MRGLGAVHNAVVLLEDFPAYRHGTPWTTDLASSSATLFMADVMGPNGPTAPGDFGGDDLVVTFETSDLTVTLFRSQHGANPWVEGVLLAVRGSEPPAGRWQPILVGATGSQRFCIDSGAVVLGPAEAFDVVAQTREDPEASSALAIRVLESGLLGFADNIYFNADVNCHDCWGVGNVNKYTAVYIDLSTTKR